MKFGGHRKRGRGGYWGLIPRTPSPLCLFFFVGLISELGMSSKMSWEFENGFLDNSIYIYIFCSHLMSKPVTYVASNLLANDSQLDVRIAFNDLQQKIKQAEYFTCDPLITQPIFYLYKIVQGMTHVARAAVASNNCLQPSAMSK